MANDLIFLRRTKALSLWPECRNIGINGFYPEIQICGTQATPALVVLLAGSTSGELQFPAEPRRSVRVQPSTLRNTTRPRTLTSQQKSSPVPGYSRAATGQSPETWKESLHSRDSSATPPAPGYEFISPASHRPHRFASHRPHHCLAS